MITAATITDEQIRELDVPADTKKLALEWLAYRAFWRAAPDDDLAAVEYHAASAARARCAEIINARNKGQSNHE